VIIVQRLRQGQHTAGRSEQRLGRQDHRRPRHQHLPGGTNNGAGSKDGTVIDKRDIKIEVGKGDKIVYGGKEVKAKEGDTVEIHDGKVTVKSGG
jgi:hypothetical protein